MSGRRGREARPGSQADRVGTPSKRGVRGEAPERDILPQGFSIDPRSKAGPLLGGLGLAWIAREVYRRLRYGGLRGEVALVTGATRGLGFLIARELAREGCRLAICARDEDEVTRAVEDLHQQGAEALGVPCDVSQRGAVEALVARVTGHYGRIDLLVNNAGVIAAGPAQVVTVEDLEQALGVMFWGLAYPTLAVLPQMRARRRGRIVNVTSVGGKAAVPHLLAYGAAKFAAVGFSEGLRAELARDGITVTTIVPGLMRTGSVFNATFKGQPEREFAPFAVLASLPFLSIDAERAARQVVTATKRGEAERILGLSATLLAHFHGLFPGLTADILGLINRALPGPGDGATPPVLEPVPGKELHPRVRSPLFDKLIGWNRSAARRLHQYPSHPRSPAARYSSSTGSVPAYPREVV